MMRRTDMSIAAFITLAMTQSPTPPVNTEFDFWLGEWECVGKSRTKPGEDQWTETKTTNSIRRILKSQVIEENFSMPGFEGRSHTVYDARNKQWRQTWVDSSGAYLVFVGGKVADTMVLNQVMGANAPAGLKMRMVFSKIAATSLQWDWQRSADDGKTWETQWNLAYRRKG